MVGNKLKLWVASGLAIVGVASAGVVSFASAHTPPPTASTAIHSQVTTANDKEVSDKSAVDTDNVNDQQGNQNQQGPDNSNAVETNDSASK